MVPQTRHPPARLPAAHDCESTTHTHGVRTLYLRERRPLEARQRTQLPAHLGGSGPHGAILAVFVVVTTSLERTARLLGRSRGDDIARFSDNDYEHAAALESGIWNTAQDWVEEQKILEHRPLKIAPWSNLIIIPMIGQIIQATLFMLLVFGFFMGFSSIAISDTTIESWMSIKPEHLKILGVDTNINAVVIKVSMIVAVFSGLSFVATTSSDEKYARSFLKPMIERIKHILIIRDIYLGLLTMPKNEVLIPLDEEKSTEKETDKA